MTQIDPVSDAGFGPVCQASADRIAAGPTPNAFTRRARPRFSHIRTAFPGSRRLSPTPRQRLTALLLELYGDEWLLIPAMHYRRNFPDHNLPFVYDELGGMAFAWFSKPIRRVVGKRIGTRFQGFVPRLGVTHETRAAIESAYATIIGPCQATCALRQPRWPVGWGFGWH